MMLVIFLLGLSFALNISLVAFLIFVFRNKSTEDLIYEKFDKSVNIEKEKSDPFAKL